MKGKTPAWGPTESISPSALAMLSTRTLFLDACTLCTSANWSAPDISSPQVNSNPATSRKIGQTYRFFLLKDMNDKVTNECQSFKNSGIPSEGLKAFVCSHFDLFAPLPGAFPHINTLLHSWSAAVFTAGSLSSLWRGEERMRVSGQKSLVLQCHSGHHHSKC